MLFHVHTALSAGIICASLALGEAGIEMYDLVSSCSLVRKQLCLEILVLEHFNFYILVNGFSMVILAHINYMALHARQQVLFSLRWLSIKFCDTVDVLFFILSLQHEIRCRIIIKTLKK